MGDQDHLDDMLARVKRLREERRQILSDMSMLKSAFDDSGNGDSCVTSPEAVPGEEKEGFRFPTRQRTKRVKEASEVDNDDGMILCVICGARLGRRLNVGAVMHLGLEDGDPICPKALFLTADSRAKLRNVALTKNLEPEGKLEMLKMVNLQLETEGDGEAGLGESGEDEDSSSRLGIERFLDEMEQRRDRDRQESAAIRAGLLPGPDDTEAEEDDDEGVEAATELEVTINDHDGDEEEEEETEGADLEEEEEWDWLQRRLDEDQICDDDDDEDASGKERVLRPDLVPEEYGLEGQPRLSLLRQISSSPKLRHVKTRDRSAPYIPEDTEIYFYAGGPANGGGGGGRNRDSRVPDASSIASKRYCLWRERDPENRDTSWQNK